ncbi:MAG TPA: glycosyltransferase [Candidatus Sulfotelmatobacter sp.]|nr:glycosyltransferase [Candidatus Sulfotelmatobacter sp.]
MLHNKYMLPGGEDQSSAAETALLRDYGHEVELLEEDNRRIEKLGKVRTALRTIWSSESYHRIYKKLRNGNFDILHVQNFFPLLSPATYYAAARCGIPVVQTLHNYRLMCVNALFFRNQRICEECSGGLLPWRGIVHACYRDSRAASATVAGMIGVHKMAGTWQNRVAVYIAVSEFTREKYVAGGFPPEKIVVKPNFLHPAPAPGNGGGGYALYVGRLSPEKGVVTMVTAWKNTRSSIPLKIVGEGPLTGYVKESAQSCKTIQYLGPKPLAEVFDLMRGAEFLVFPSEWYETMGRTIMEAFAVGTPVLTSSIGPPACIVVPGETGFHFQPGSATELRDKAEWCSRYLEQVRSLRASARRAFEAKYTGAANAEMLVSIYRRAQKGSAQEQSV